MRTLQKITLSLCALALLTVVGCGKNAEDIEIPAENPSKGLIGLWKLEDANVKVRDIVIEVTEETFEHEGYTFNKVKSLETERDASVTSIRGLALQYIEPGLELVVLYESDGQYELQFFFVEKLDKSTLELQGDQDKRPSLYLVKTGEAKIKEETKEEEPSLVE